MIEVDGYPIIPIGRCKDLTGMTNGDFIVLYRTKPILQDDGQAQWLTQCQKCGAYRVEKAYIIKKNTGSCSCKDDLTGRRFGRLTVLWKTDKKTSNRGNIWHCKCDCGNEKDIPAETLKRGESNSCGCLQKEKASENGKKSRIDLTGQRFGKLIAIYPIYSEDWNKHTKWHCKCDCGNEVDIDMGNLRQGFSNSCGCTLSTHEEQIIKKLSENGIQFSTQYVFKDFSQYRFDFFVENQYIIEFDGQQHFSYNGYGWNTAENFKKTRQNDILKNEYCFSHNIPLIRIPYNEDYTIDDLKLETTHFLLTPEQVEEYYNRT